MCKPSNANEPASKILERARGGASTRLGEGCPYPGHADVRPRLRLRVLRRCGDTPRLQAALPPGAEKVAAASPLAEAQLPGQCVSCNGYRSTVWALQAAVQGLLHGFHVVELHVIKAYRVSPRDFSTWQPQGPRIIP
jgi:hypothetical protein